MSSNRPTIKDIKYIIKIEHTQFLIHQFTLEIDLGELKINSSDIANDVISYSPFIDDPYDDDHTGPFKLQFHSHNPAENSLLLSIALDTNFISPYHDLLKLLLENEPNHYKKIVLSSLSKKMQRFFPEESVLTDFLSKKKEILSDINKKYNHLAQLHHQIQSKELSLRSKLNTLLHEPSGYNQLVTNHYISSFAAEKDEYDEKKENIKNTLIEKLTILNEDNTIDQEIKSAINNNFPIYTEKEQEVFNEKKLDEAKQDIKNIAKDILSQEKLMEIINHFTYQKKTLRDVYHWLILITIKKIMETLQLSNLLNDEDAEKIYKLCQAQPPEQLLQQLKFINLLIPKINQCGLLTQALFNRILSGDELHFSSQARLSGFGLESFKAEEVQKRWGYFSIAVENALIEQLEHKKPLSEMIDYARLMRQKIAKIESSFMLSKDSELFGSLRQEYATDFYSAIVNDNTISVVDPHLFPSILKTISQISLHDSDKTNTPRYFHSLASSFFNEKINYQYEWEKVSKYNVPLPKETIVISMEKDKGICSVVCTFDKITESQFNEAIKQLDSLYLKKLQQKPLANDIDLLLELGELTFHLARLYPFTRGTGAIVKWITRSILQLHYGTELNKELNDLRIGPDNNIPYDVFSHFVKTPEEYAKAFKASLEPLLPTKILSASKNT